MYIYINLEQRALAGGVRHAYRLLLEHLAIVVHRKNAQRSADDTHYPFRTLGRAKCRAVFHRVIRQRGYAPCVCVYYTRTHIRVCTCVRDSARIFHCVICQWCRSPCVCVCVYTYIYMCVYAYI